jgi:hypothetical protein
MSPFFCSTAHPFRTWQAKLYIHCQDPWLLCTSPPACEENHIRLAELHEILLLELCKAGGLPLLLPFALYVPAVKDHDRESCCPDLVQPMET